MPVLSTLGAAIANVYGFTSGLIKDQYFNLVSLLLPGNGTNGATNNSFVDSSTANSGTGWPITRNGDTTQGTFSPFSQTGWGAYFAGSGARVSTTSGSQFAFGTGDFTVEFWMYPTSSSSNVGIFDTRTANNNGLIVRLGDGASNPNVVSAYVAGTELNTKAITYNSWQHVAIVRSSGNGVIYVNGVGSTSKAASGDCSQTGCLISALYDALTSNFVGYLSNFRVVKGRAVYTSDFQPATSNLGATTGGSSPPTGTQTSLLTLQSNRFVDNGGLATPNTLTITNSVAITPFSPFAPTSSYSAAAVGGSGYFDGSGDSLSITDNAAFDFGSGAFTVEAWFYRTGGGNRTGQTVYSQSAGGASSNSALFFGAGNDGVSLYLSTSGSAWTNNIETGVAPTLNAWSHVVWQRNGNTLEIYLNGALQTVVSGSAAFSGTIFNSSRDVEIGIQQSTQGPLFGNLCNLRVVKGATVYTGNFTPPTKPLAASGADSAGSYPSTTNVNTGFASSATSLLLNFTNAGVVDATAKNDLLTVGTAQISTTQSKFGGGSIYLNGTGNYLTQPFSQLMNQLNGNFTIECWIYPTVTNTRMLFAGSVNSAGLTNWYFEITSSNKLAFNWTNTVPTSFIPTSTASISPNTWTHVAVVKNGGTLTLYINGSADGTASPTGTYAGASYGFSIGRAGDYNGLYFTGYIDDFRMTIGQARTITLPTAPFPLQ
jgi:hypothetical protein